MLTINFDPFPELNTDRLLLRRIVMEDAPEVFVFRSDPSILKYINKEPITSYEEAEEFIRTRNEMIDKGEAILWGIALSGNPSKLVGTICLWHIRKEDDRAELGYALDPRHWRKGIMKEAILKVIEYGFETLKLHSIDAVINPDNIASARSLEATGFVKEGHLKENIFFKGEYQDTGLYALLRP